MVVKYEPKKKFMEIAIKEALRECKKNNAVPIGAVVVKDDKMIAKSGQKSWVEKDPAGHAEIVALRIAAQKLGTKNMHGCILYTTNEPCAMCASACVWGCLKGIVYGSNMKDMKNYWLKKRKIPKSHFRMILMPCKEIIRKTLPKNALFVIGNFMREECNKLFGYSPNVFERKEER